jgi:hypothetical protein
MPKPTQVQLDFWDQELSKHNLGVNRGLAGKTLDGSRRLIHIGDSNDLESAMRQVIDKKSGRVRPKGAGPD